MLGKNPQQPRHRAQLLDSGHVADIALDDRFDVVEMPVLPAAPARTGQRLGVAARENGFHEVVADDRSSGCRGLAPERLVEKGRGGVAQLRLGERQQADDSHAAASESATRGSVIRSADPVSRNRPGRGSASTAVLIASTRLGAR